MSNPNPFKNELLITDIKAGEEYEVKIFNVLGELKINNFINSENNILNTQSLANGTYIISIKTEGYTYYKKLIKSDI